MQTKGRIMLMVIAGGYLAYLGGGLVTDAMKEKPENYILYTVVGVLFLIIGAACCLFNPVSYTHLDVYKRQIQFLWKSDRSCHRSGKGNLSSELCG